ncbi:hypothetical protein RIF29_39840 [Crotalaria pallida]|uniref:Pentatricopeptide repeat protein n=1 Tax=Crotalaria pallida TaxID=3830 RepID=A0AAN9HMV5_CROPI
MHGTNAALSVNDFTLSTLLAVCSGSGVYWKGSSVDGVEKNVVSYNALLSGFCRNGEGLKALDMFIKMVEEGVELTDFSLTSVVNVCILIADYEVSKQVHGFVLKFGCGLNACIEATLVDMYRRCEKI